VPWRHRRCRGRYGHAASWSWPPAVRPPGHGPAMTYTNTKTPVNNQQATTCEGGVRGCPACGARSDDDENGDDDDAYEQRRRVTARPDWVEAPRALDDTTVPGHRGEGKGAQPKLGDGDRDGPPMQRSMHALYGRTVAAARGGRSEWPPLGPLRQARWQTHSQAAAAASAGAARSRGGRPPASHAAYGPFPASLPSPCHTLG